ncbi:hypothetical protein BDV98DRAFT_657023 [Pterulicium gracile]|uniref:Uncharacterized protein n=1 Tax=Pterulicium gracile TaxID=1884261 RepID=A0A5C3QI60_9AGAR|nr:hypothetical protein BDV98DRAFT_657023 [Pterula gracilis]
MSNTHSQSTSSAAPPGSSNRINLSSSRATELAARLSSVKTMAQGCGQILSLCGPLSAEEFSLNARKIVALIEIARVTLRRSRIAVYHRPSDSQAKVDCMTPLKQKYFEMLAMLQQRRTDIPDTLQVRVSSLLIPLRRSTGTTEYPSEAQTPQRHVFTPPAPLSASSDTSSNLVFLTAAMSPPPSLSPLARRLNRKRPTSLSHDRRKTRDPIWPKDEQKDVMRQFNLLVDPPPPVKLQPLRRRFGIFCTLNNSMFRGKDSGSGSQWDGMHMHQSSLQNI